MQSPFPDRISALQAASQEELLEEAAPEVARQAIAVAKAGKGVAMKLVLERVMPRANDRRLQLDNLIKPAQRTKFTDTLAPDDLLQAHNNLIQAVTEGELSPIEAQAISQLLEARRRSWESVELREQLNDLQERFEEYQRNHGGHR